MRTRGLAILTVAVLAFSACSSASRPKCLQRAPTGQRGSPAAQRTGHQRARRSTASAAAGVTDTLQMHWLGDLTAIWHPASQETFSQAINFQLMFDKLLERKWDGDGPGSRSPTSPTHGTSARTA